MEIKFYGHSCFTITEEGKTILINPYSDSIGLKLPSLSADIVLVSHNNEAYTNVDAVSGDPRVFNWPGEYESGGIHLKGIHSFHNDKDDEEQLENIVFNMHFNNIHLCHLGAQGTKLTPEQLGKIGDVDILFLPIAGGKESIDAKKAKEIIEQIEPRIVIPMTYHTDGNNRDIASLESFLTIMGAQNVEQLDSFKVKRTELPEDNSKIVVLNPVK